MKNLLRAVHGKLLVGVVSVVMGSISSPGSVRADETSPSELVASEAIRVDGVEKLLVMTGQTTLRGTSRPALFHLKLTAVPFGSPNTNLSAGSLIWEDFVSWTTMGWPKSTRHFDLECALDSDQVYVLVVKHLGSYAYIDLYRIDPRKTSDANPAKYGYDENLLAKDPDPRIATYRFHLPSRASGVKNVSLIVDGTTFLVAFELANQVTPAYVRYDPKTNEWSKVLETSPEEWIILEPPQQPQESQADLEEGDR